MTQRVGQRIARRPLRSSRTRAHSQSPARADSAPTRVRNRPATHRREIVTTPAARRTAKRVFPTPPAPVNDSRRAEKSRRGSSRSCSSRPTKLVTSAGRLWRRASGRTSAAAGAGEVWPGDGSTTSTGATNRYPLPATVSTNRRDWPKSPNTCRILRIAVWIPASRSVKTSGVHRRFTISSRHTSCWRRSSNSSSNPSVDATNEPACRSAAPRRPIRLPRILRTGRSCGLNTDGHGAVSPPTVSHARRPWYRRLKNIPDFFKATSMAEGAVVRHNARALHHPFEGDSNEFSHS